MTKLVAIFEVQIPKDGKLVAIKPGTGFVVDDAKAEAHLRKAEAVRDPTDDELESLFSRPIKADELPVGEPDLSKMTKPELVAYAKSKGFTVDESATKSDMLLVVQAQVSAAEEL